MQLFLQQEGLLPFSIFVLRRAYLTLHHLPPACVLHAPTIGASRLMSIFLEALEGGGWSTRAGDYSDDMEECQKGTSIRSSGFSDAKSHVLGYGDVRSSRRGLSLKTEKLQG